jgi:RNA polymerase sigma-70 factor (ECF subfamily)
VEDSTRTITTAIASGDTEAFSRLYLERFDDCLAEARRATGRDEAFCLDVVQETMMRVIRSMKPLETAADLRRWLNRVVRNCAYDLLRRERRTLQRDLARGPRDAIVEPLHELDDRLTWLRQQLDAVNGDAGALLMLRHRFGLSLSQIGAIVGLRSGAVDGRVNRAIARLRRQAKEKFHE